ncbi:WD40 repeat-like protein [Gymnopus androsaceus JB14]|uniref:WD40 repeat-like protein n=1 Tax=Gymnopus androsaceus JB14 TaxID=1447944 RepID=A0A6A4GWW4_9AGAR|nr:WD40 repeat-like protein [Gymnopus androsaceus JB14]
MGDTLKGHNHWVNSVAFSVDGTKIVSGSDDKTVRIWDATMGAQIGDALDGHDDRVTSVAFSLDGLRIVSGSADNTIRIWDVTTDSPKRTTLGGHHKLLQAKNTWSLSTDGWIISPNCPHGIIWIPPQFRRHLWRPWNTCIISQAGYTKLSFEGCVYGEDWFQCIED